MRVTVEFRLLGGVEVLVDGLPVDLGHVRRRLVLGVLLADVNRVVPVDQLVTRVWGEESAQRARGTLYSYVSRLRQALASTEGVGLDRAQGGYVLTTDPETVDVHHFRELLRQARASADDEQAAALFEEALGLWRGEPFAHLDSPWVRTVRGAWAQERFSAQLDHHDVLLRQGRHAELVTSLESAAQEHPLDERLAGQAMLALHSCGRAAEALQRYEDIRSRLAEELGIDPGPELQQLHQRILAAEGSGTASPASPPAAAAAAAAARTAVSVTPCVVPRQLPMPPALFTGRETELAELTAAARAGEAGGTVVISAIGGSGGIGKTYLALHWAHRHVERFPDGQLYADLRGFDPSGPPVAPLEVLRGFLQALGVQPADMPNSTEAQAGLYRSLVTGKLILILLDNARDSAQVLPLLPGSPTCTVLVTSRNQLGGLITGHGARPLTVDVLPETEARQLLTRHLGPERVTAEPDAVTALVKWCAGLPLALSITASRAAAQPGFPLTHLVGELRETAGRLDALDTGEVTTNLRAVFDTSYHALDDNAARVFALLGLARGPDISLHAAASLTGRPLPRARALLRALQSAHLAHEHTPGRYRMHDLVRLYAAERATRDHDTTTREQALHRLIDFYVHTGQNASLLRTPQQLVGSEPGPPAEDVTPQPLADAAAAAQWFTTEEPCLIATHQLAVERGWHTAVWQLPWALYPYSRTHLDCYEYRAMWQAALTAAEHLDDPQRLAIAHFGLGNCHLWLGLPAEALDYLERAHTLFQGTGNLPGQAHSHLVAGVCCWEIGDVRQALRYEEHALRLYRQIGAHTWEATMLNNVGWTHALMGNYEQAERHCREALDLCHQLGDHSSEAVTLDSLGYIAHRTGRHAEALDFYHQALTMHQHSGTADDQAETLDHIGDVHHDLGQHAEARRAWEQAAMLYRARHLTTEADRVQAKTDSLDPAPPDQPQAAPASRTDG